MPNEILDSPTTPALASEDVTEVRNLIAAVSQPSATPAASPESQGTRTLFTRRTRSLLGVQVLACGSYVPEQTVTNDDLHDRLGFDPEWIKQRSGIVERRHIADDRATSDLCFEAATRAIRAAKVDPQQIDMLVVGTSTPDFQMPSAACIVQEKLGLDAPAFDVSAACAGFMYAFVTGAQFVATGNANLALVIGADAMSRITDPGDQRTHPLFGDGAGAVLLARGGPHQGLICYQMGSDGSGVQQLVIPHGGSQHRLTEETFANREDCIKMDGRSVFKWAVRMLTDTIELVLEKSGMSPHDVSLYVLHQANIRIIDSAMEQLGVPPEKVFVNLDKYGNTSAGSIPIVLDEAIQAGRINRGDTVMLCGFGAGLTWGTGLFRW
ncbi:MAG: ketoacyl-ACP synthase III [Planctomycetaceae bacterium]|nr:ketoacyl-ACP synthase III [Planctomycetaceae bacterium]